MKRRAFIVGLAGAAALSPQAYAQQSSKVWLIAFLGPAPAFASVPRVEALRTGLRELRGQVSAGGAFKRNLRGIV